MKFLPYGRQTIGAEDLAAVAEALMADFLTTGPLVDALEADLAKRLKVEHAVVCSNGTAALHLAVLAAGIGPGDRVIVPSITFVATANAVRYCGGEVIFADVDPDSGLIDLPSLERAVERAGGSVAAIMPVHLAGQMAPVREIAAFATQHGARVIEDACHAIGSRSDDGDPGECAHSLAATFSFHPVKTVTSGEGGAIATSDAGMARRMRLLRNHGLIRDPEAFVDPTMGLSREGQANSWYYELQELGMNYRLPDLNCALVLSQLRRLESFAERRRLLVHRYEEALSGIEPRLKLMKRKTGQRPCWHLMVVLIDFDAVGFERQSVMARLREQGIGTQVHYIPVHRQPYYRKRYGELHLPGADNYYSRALSLPLFPDMTESDVDRVADALREILKA